jgi:hypothetical protein
MGACDAELAGATACGSAGEEITDNKKANLNKGISIDYELDALQLLGLRRLIANANTAQFHPAAQHPAQEVIPTSSATD